MITQLTNVNLINNNLQANNKKNCLKNWQACYLRTTASIIKKPSWQTLKFVNLKALPQWTASLTHTQKQGGN